MELGFRFRALRAFLLRVWDGGFGCGGLGLRGLV